MGCTNKLDILTSVGSAITVFMYFCLRTNTDLCHLHLKKKLIGFYNRGEKGLRRGTD
jgi:hypothetical protein